LYVYRKARRRPLVPPLPDVERPVAGSPEQPIP